jgi:hypothetical protein
MEELTNKQNLLITELNDDIEFYREELKAQISNTRIAMYLGIGLCVVVGVVLFINPEWVARIQELSDHMGTITGVVGEVLPITFASKSFNNIKTQKKKLQGLRVFEKELGRMKLGILPNKEQHILEFESELIKYITT